MRKKFPTPYSNPKCCFYEIIHVFNHPDELFTARDVSLLFDLTRADARLRMFNLKRWSLVNVVSRSQSWKNPTVYKVSRWGKKYLHDQAHRLNLQGNEIEESTPVPTD